MHTSYTLLTLLFVLALFLLLLFLLVLVLLFLVVLFFAYALQEHLDLLLVVVARSLSETVVTLRRIPGEGWRISRRKSTYSKELMLSFNQ